MPRSINLERTMSRKTRPPLAELPPWEPGKSAHRMLLILNRYRYLTTHLVGMAYAARTGRGYAQVRHELRRLWDYRLVERFHRPVDVGSSQYVYTLSVDGAHHVIDPKDWADERRRIYNLASGKANYEHQLAVSLIHLLWDLGSPAKAALFMTAASWHDKQGTRDKVTNRFVAKVGGRDVTIDPDACFLIAHQKRNYYRPILFEVERTHKNYDRLHQRFLAYAYLLGPAGDHVIEKVFEDELGLRPDRAMAVFVGANRAHAERLRLTAIAAVKKSLGLAASDKIPRTELWFTSLDLLLEQRPRCRKDGTPYLDRRGQPQLEEVPIAPADFFNTPILTSLRGKRGHVIV